MSTHREPDEHGAAPEGDGRPRISLCEVGPRDGLQNHARSLEPERRAELVERLAATGIARVETASFVDPRRVPQMAGAEEVVAAIERRPGVVYAGLVLNERGYERFRATGLDEVRFALAATESFGRRNANVGVEESLGIADRILARARADGVRASATISVAFGCPFEGAVEAATVARIAERLAGWDELVVADTIGVAVPRQVRELLALARDLPCPLGVHFHDTRGTGLANALAAVEAGASVLDASVGGLGGCPFAPNATGNICTEDLVYLLHGQGIDTGVDLDALIEVADWLEGVLGERLEGRVRRAGTFAPVAGFVRAG